MPFLALHVVLSFLLDLAHALTRSDRAKDLELLLLRQQLRLYERQATPPPRRSCWEQGPLAAIAAKLPELARVCLSSTPATPPRSHRPMACQRCPPGRGPGSRGRPGGRATGDARAGGAGAPRGGAPRRKWSSEWSSGAGPAASRAMSGPQIPNRGAEKRCPDRAACAVRAPGSRPVDLRGPLIGREARFSQL